MVPNNPVSRLRLRHETGNASLGQAQQQAESYIWLVVEPQVLYMKVSRLFQSCSQPPRYRGKKWAKYQYYQVQAAILPLVAASTDNGFEQPGFRDDIQPFQVAPLRGDKDPGDRRAA
jgi:hypothetical protein